MDYYESKELCENAHYKRQSSNSRYKFFKQQHFTCGDENQFIEFKDELTNTTPIVPHIENTNLFFNTDFHIWDLYNDLQAIDVLNTFRYIFYKFKKGIFVKIIDNKLKVFLPFSNVNFVNEWANNINKGEVDFDILKNVSENDGRIYNQNFINKYIHTWFANNFLVRYEYPINETDTNMANFKNFFEELCQNRQIPDIEFFINKRDFPIITKNLTEPYFHLWDSFSKPLVSHSYDKYLPILSMCRNNNYADLLLPTHEDWARVQSHENKWFIHSYRSCEPKQNIDNIIDFDTKKPIAVFRGTSTGNGFTIKDNQRLNISFISSMNFKDLHDGLPYLDAGITKWNFRPKKIINCHNLQTLDFNSLPFDLVPSLTYIEQASYKYIIHIDGHVTAFRLSLELSMNSVILMVKTDWEIWFSHLLIPYHHYIPVKNDCSDIIEQIKWCKANNEKCKQIAKNARLFYDTYLSKNGMFDYTQKLLIDLKKSIGNYSYITNLPHYNLQIQNYSFHFITSPTNVYNKLLFPSQRRYGQFKALQHFFKNHYHYHDKTLHFQNENVQIFKANVCGFNIALKKTNKNNLHHELFAGININKIVKHIPNFLYTFGFDEQNFIVTEFIQGIRFFDFINDTQNFNIQTYIHIIMQLCLALHVAQYNILFTHNDLTAWNIILIKTKNNTKIDYILQNGQIFTITTNIIPVIIDYEKSHFSKNFTHCGSTNPHTFSSIQDILTLLITSIYQIIVSNKLDRQAYSIILTLANFFSNSQYCPQTFHNFKQLKSFLMYKKKHSSLIYSNKYELESLNPLHLFYYITNKCHFKFSYHKSSIFNSFMNKSYYKQVYLFLLTKNNEDQLLSFNHSILNIKSSISSIHKNNIDSIYLYNKFIIILNLIANDLSIFSSFNHTINNHFKILHSVDIHINDFTSFNINELTKYNQKLIQQHLQLIHSSNYDISHLQNTFILLKKIRFLHSINSIYTKNYHDQLNKSTSINLTLSNIQFIQDLTS